MLISTIVYEGAGSWSYLCDMLAQQVLLLIDVVDIHVCQSPVVHSTQQVDAFGSQYGAYEVFGHVLRHA